MCSGSHASAVAMVTGIPTEKSSGSVPEASAWLNGCQVARRTVTFESITDSHTPHTENQLRAIRPLCVCMYVLMCSCAEEQVIRVGVWVGGLQYKHFSGLGIWINESSHFYSQIQGTQACIFNLMNSLQVNVCINNIKQHCEYIYVQLLWIYCPLQFACAVNTIKPSFVLMSKKAVLQTEKKRLLSFLQFHSSILSPTLISETNI